MKVARRVSTGHTQVLKNKATPTLHDNDQPNAALAILERGKFSSLA
jgi:hypothetical protein